jgi:SAM-dependent methyltransferase
MSTPSCVSTIVDHANRPMLEEDLESVKMDQNGLAIRRMVRDYSSQFLPVMNGSFEYSNLREGPSQQLTCHPYRLWEYSSLFKGWAAEPGAPVLDVGGAASPLPYFLAEQGYDVTTTDLQELLVDIANDVAKARRIPLRAVANDIASDTRSLGGPFALVTFVSVIEHIAVSQQAAILRAIYNVLRPGGLLYMTFDYGSFAETTRYSGEESERSQAISDIIPLAAQLEEIGFRFCGNDPRGLPVSVLALKASPRFREIAKEQRMLSGPMDSETPWKTWMGYAVRRAFPLGAKAENRLGHHNFFRFFLEKPAEDKVEIPC